MTTRQLLAGIPGLAASFVPPNFGRIYIVDPAGNYTRSSLRTRTIQDAVDRAESGDTILVAPGAYDETVTVARAKSKLHIIGLGGRGAAFIEPSTEDAGGMIVHADDVTLENLGVAGEDTTSAIALLVTGSRFRAYRCKLEGALDQLVIGPGTVLQEAAGTHGVGADALFEDCEFAWGTNGVHLKGSNYGACTQPRFRKCLFHNLATHFKESHGAGGANGLHFMDLRVEECIFNEAEDGTPATKYFDMNDDNANSGMVSRCTFPTALNSGLSLVSTALLWVGNIHPAGLSNGQPS